VIVFAFDEAENIRPVLGELRAWLEVNEPDAEIVFVDDGSRDHTLDLAQRALLGFPASFARHESNRGIGAAIKTGTLAARAPWVTFMPADGQIPPSAIGTLRAAATDESVAVFSTYEKRDDGVARKVLSFGVRALITAIHGVIVRSDGPYLFRRALLDPAQIPPDTFFLNFELPIRLVASGLAFRQVEIPCRPRLSGRSKSARFGVVLAVGRDLLEMRGRRLREMTRVAFGRGEES
jgi:dolichol-phosphate mannosyltransferase